jgi:hypothetical protein
VIRFYTSQLDCHESVPNVHQFVAFLVSILRPRQKLVVVQLVYHSFQYGVHRFSDELFRFSVGLEHSSRCHQLLFPCFDKHATTDVISSMESSIFSSSRRNLAVLESAYAKLASCELTFLLVFELSVVKPYEYESCLPYQ